jgi:hypothetical protein
MRRLARAKPFEGEGSKGMRKSGASSSLVVVGQTVTEAVRSK